MSTISRLVANFRPGSVGSSPDDLAVIGNALLCRADDGSSGAEPLTQHVTVDFSDITLAVDHASAREDGASSLIYSFSCTCPSAEASSVNYGITETAAAADYAQATPGEGKAITVATGAVSADFAIDPMVDFTGEANETAVSTRESGNSYTLCTVLQVISIVTND